MPGIQPVCTCNPLKKGCEKLHLTAGALFSIFLTLIVGKKVDGWEMYWPHRAQKKTHPEKSCTTRLAAAARCKKGRHS
jgi:hypothetical protein